MPTLHSPILAATPEPEPSRIDRAPLALTLATAAFLPETPVDVVVNTEPGGFSLSNRAFYRLKELGVTYPDLSKFPPESYTYQNMNRWHGSRHDPRLIRVVHELGPDANGALSKLGIRTSRTPWYTIRADSMGIEHICPQQPPIALVYPTQKPDEWSLTPKIQGAPRPALVFHTSGFFLESTDHVHVIK